MLLPPVQGFPLCQPQPGGGAGCRGPLVQQEGPPPPALLRGQALGLRAAGQGAGEAGAIAQARCSQWGWEGTTGAPCHPSTSACSATAGADLARSQVPAAVGWGLPWCCCILCPLPIAVSFASHDFSFLFCPTELVSIKHSLSSVSPWFLHAAASLPLLPLSFPLLSHSHACPWPRREPRGRTTAPARAHTHGVNPSSLSCDSITADVVPSPALPRSCPRHSSCQPAWPLPPCLVGDSTSASWKRGNSSVGFSFALLAQSSAQCQFGSPPCSLPHHGNGFTPARMS